MRTLRSRFVLSHLLPLLLVLPLLAVALIYLLETQILLAEMSDDITAQANLIAENLGQRPDLLSDAADSENYLARVGIYIDGRIFLIQADGDLLATTDPALSDQVGEPLDVAGLQQAFSGEQSITISYGIRQQTAVVLVPVLDVNQQLLGIVGVSQSLGGIADQVGQARGVILLTFLVALLLSGLLGAWLARRLERPISEVATAVTEIAYGERIDPIPVSGPREIRQLIGSVNFLADRLFKLEDTRKRLLANLVHEIGRPLGAMRAAVHVMRQGAADDPEIRAELLAGLDAEIGQMQPLLDDLAQLHGSVLGAFELERQPVALADWLGTALRPWQAAAVQKGLAWQETIPADLPVVDIDPVRMAQVLGNLLSNAVKYTPPGSAIAVTADAAPESVHVHVSDTGPGILPAEQEQVFEPFFRSTEQRRFPQGLGLGLTIGRDIVEAHGGTLTLQSVPQQGSRFTITLPVTPKS